MKQSGRERERELRHETREYKGNNGVIKISLNCSFMPHFAIRDFHKGSHRVSYPAQKICLRSLVSFFLFLLSLHLSIPHRRRNAAYFPRIQKTFK